MEISEKFCFDYVQSTLHQRIHDAAESDPCQSISLSFRPCWPRCACENVDYPATRMFITFLPHISENFTTTRRFKHTLCFAQVSRYLNLFTYVKTIGRARTWAQIARKNTSPRRGEKDTRITCTNARDQPCYYILLWSDAETLG